MLFYICEIICGFKFIFKVFKLLMVLIFCVKMMFFFLLWLKVCYKIVGFVKNEYKWGVVL